MNQAEKPCKTSIRDEQIKEKIANTFGKKPTMDPGGGGIAEPEIGPQYLL